MASRADLVVDLLGGQLHRNHRFGLFEGDPCDRLDAFEHGGLLSRTVIGGDIVDHTDEGSSHEQHDC
jgi:hypothetical protein